MGVRAVSKSCAHRRSPWFSRTCTGGYCASCTEKLGLEAEVTFGSCGSPGGSCELPLGRMCDSSSLFATNSKCRWGASIRTYTCSAKLHTALIWRERRYNAKPACTPEDSRHVTTGIESGSLGLGITNTDTACIEHCVTPSESDGGCILLTLVTSVTSRHTR